MPCAPCRFAGRAAGSIAQLLKPLSESWPTYSGDYTGRRYSALTEINQQTVRTLTLAWAGHVTPGQSRAIVGGEGTGEFGADGGSGIKGTPLMVDGTLYVSTPDNAWALDALDGHELWHYFWKTRGGTHIANRGLGMWNGVLFMETPDNYLVSLDAKTGRERWHRVIADFSQQYFSTAAPIVVGNHVIVGVGNDLDQPGFLQSFDAESGDLQWKLYTVPMNPGIRRRQLAQSRGGKARRRDALAARRVRSETKLAIFGTGNPFPRTIGRGEGQSLHLFARRGERRHRKDGVALPDVPHDMHDGTRRTPSDRRRDGRAPIARLDRRAQALFLHLDRATGEHPVTARYGTATNWVKEIDAKDRSARSRQTRRLRARLFRAAGGTINLEPPHIHPIRASSTCPRETDTRSLFDRSGPSRLDGPGRQGGVGVGSAGSFLTAIDWERGRSHGARLSCGQRRRRRYARDGRQAGLRRRRQRNIVAHDAASGKPLWHFARIGDERADHLSCHGSSISSSPPVTSVRSRSTGRTQFVLWAGTVRHDRSHCGARLGAGVLLLTVRFAGVGWSRGDRPTRPSHVVLQARAAEAAARAGVHRPVALENGYRVRGG